MSRDTESAKREAKRQALAQIRSRPRPENDAPSLDAWFETAPAGLEEGVRSYLDLLANLRGTNRYIERWQIIRTPAEFDTGIGLDIISDPDGYLEYLNDAGVSESYRTLDAMAFSRRIFPDEPSVYSAFASYQGKSGSRGLDRLYFSCAPSHVDHNLSLQEWSDLIGVVVSWRKTRYVTVGSSEYPMRDRVFDNRAWKGWIGWFPVEIDRSILPSYALVAPVGDGTLIATQETNVISRHQDQRLRANEVEVALHDAGLLPLERDLKG